MSDRRSKSSTARRQEADSASTSILNGRRSLATLAILLLFLITTVTNANAATTTTTTMAAALTSASSTVVTTAPYGTSVTLTATLSPTTAVGTVTFNTGGTPLGSPVTVSSGKASLATTALPLGADSLTATFTPTNSANFTTSAFGGETFTVSQATTTTALAVALTSAPTAAITAASYGASVTLTATITPTTAPGTVTFKTGTTTLAGSPVTVSAGTATLATTALLLGTNSLTAVFNPTTPADFTSTTSSPKSVNVTQTTTTTALAVALTSAPSAAITAAHYGTSVTLTATISPTTAVGSVTFYTGGSTPLGSPVTVSSGSAILVTAALPLGTPDSLTAAFSPTTGADFTTSTSSPKTVTVSQATTATTLTAALTSALSSPVTTAPSGTSVTLTATLSPTTAVGSVAFKTGTTQIGSLVPVSAGSATLATTALPQAIDSLTAVFSPTTSADFTTSTSNTLSFTVTKPTTTTALVASGPYYYDSPVTLTANITPSVATGGPVTFKNGTTTVGSCTLSSGTCNTSVSSLPLGPDTLSAVYGGDSIYAGSTSGTSNITVLVTPTLVGLVPSVSEAAPDTSFGLTATVTAQAGSATVSSGSVTFYDSSTSLGKASVNSSGIATLTVTGGLTAPGNHYLIASYGGVYSGGSAEFGTSISASAKVSISSGQTITFTQPTSPAAYGTTAALAATSTSGLTVKFSTTSSTVCSISVSTLSYIGVGSCMVTANQAGNGSYTAATPVSNTVTVNAAVPTISHWNNTGTVYGTPVTFLATASGGGAITYAVISGPGGVIGSILTPTAAGAIVVGATVAASADYSAVTTPVTKTVTVNQAPLLITASSPTLTYGTAVPTITPIYATLVNGDATITATPTCHTAYTITSNPGSYQTYCYGAVDANYSITYATGSVAVSKATPSISIEPTPSQITYGAALSTSTLTSGTASVTGAFAWTTGTGSTIPHVGSTQSVTFTPTNTPDYTTAPGTVAVNVVRATPTIATPPTASAVQYDLTLSASRLSGGAATNPVNSASVSGSFTWTTGSTTLTTIGANSEGVIFTPADSSDYTTATGNASVTVTKATAPVSVWPTAPSITYGSALSASILSGGVAGVLGGFAWTTPTVVPSAGTHSESVTFTPTNTADYANATATVQIAVSKLTATVNSWPTASSITYGQALSSSRLSGGSASTPGTFTWTLPATTPGAGTPSEGVTFTPTNSTLYGATTGPINVTVIQATPTVSIWPTASPSYTPGTLDNSTLSGGSASVDGGFAWPDSTVTLAAGNNLYSVTFTPSDSSDYSTVTGSVNITVNPCGLQDSANSSYSAAQYFFADGYTPTLPSPNSIDVEGTNGSAVCAVGDTSVTPTVTYPLITSNSASTYTADSGSYGTNAAVLAYGAEASWGTGATITIADDGSGDPGSISTANDYSNGVFASMGGTVNITDTIVNTSGNNSHGLDATYEGTLIINNVQASTAGTNSSVILAGVGGGNVTVAGGVYTSGGSLSAGIRAAGTGSTVGVSDGPAGITITALNAAAVVVEGGNSVSITSTGGGTSLSGAAGADHGIFLYEGDSGDAAAGPGSFTMANGSIAYTCDATESPSCSTGLAANDQNSPATLFSVANTTATITLTDVTVTNDTPTDTDSYGTLLTAAALHSGTTGENGGNVTLTAYGETLTGDIIVDSISTVNLILQADSASPPAGSTLTGAINNANSGAVTVSLTLDAASSWIVTGDSYLTALTNPVAGNTNITCAASCTVYVGGSPITIGN